QRSTDRVALARALEDRSFGDRERPLSRDEALAAKRITQRAELVGAEHLAQLGLRAQAKGRAAVGVDEQLRDIGIEPRDAPTLTQRPMQGDADPMKTQLLADELTLLATHGRERGVDRLRELVEGQRDVGKLLRMGGAGVGWRELERADQA